MEDASLNKGRRFNNNSNNPERQESQSKSRGGGKRDGSNESYGRGGGAPRRGGRYSGEARRGDYGGRDYNHIRGGYHGHHRGGTYQRGDEREVKTYSEQVLKHLEGRRLFVSNLSYDTQWKYLKDHMRPAGDVVRADIFEDMKGRSRGIGYVKIANCVF